MTPAAKARATRLFRFALVGASVALIYYLMFLWLRGAGVGRGAASTLAFGVAVLFQYVAQTWWTFGASPAEGRYALRFGVMVTLGALIAAAITGVVGPAAGAPDRVSALVTVVTLPVFNFIVINTWSVPHLVIINTMENLMKFYQLMYLSKQFPKDRFIKLTEMARDSFLNCDPSEIRALFLSEKSVK